MRSEAFTMPGYAVESDAQSLRDSPWTARFVSSGCKPSVSAETLTMALLDVKSLPNRKFSNFYLFPIGDLGPKGI